MMTQTDKLRWGRVITWIVLCLAAAGAIVLVVILWPKWTQDRTSERAEKTPLPEPPAKLRRLDEKTLAVPCAVRRALDIRTTEVVTASRPRTLPPLTGCLALDTNRLVRVHTRFAGEVVSLGKTGGRPLRCGDKVSKGQPLAIVWSKDLGEKKSELADALSRLRIDRSILDRLR